MSENNHFWVFFDDSTRLTSTYIYLERNLGQQLYILLVGHKSWRSDIIWKRACLTFSEWLIYQFLPRSPPPDLPAGKGGEGGGKQPDLYCSVFAKPHSLFFFKSSNQIQRTWSIIPAYIYHFTKTNVTLCKFDWDRKHKHNREVQISKRKFAEFILVLLHSKYSIVTTQHNSWYIAMPVCMQQM